MDVDDCGFFWHLEGCLRAIGSFDGGGRLC